MKNLFLFALALISLSVSAGNMTTKLIVNNPICHSGNDGTIDLFVFGGNAPLTYTWDNGLPATASHSNLAAGTYSFTVTDSTGDVVSGSVVIAEPNDIAVTPNVLDVTTPGGNDGSIGLNVGGGTPIYAYSWSNNVHDRNISSLTSGTYDVEITDAAGCSKTFSFLVSEPNGFLIEKPEVKYLISKGSFQDGNNYAKNGGATGVEDVKQGTVLVYPNPANNFFKIALQPGTETQIALMTPNGQVVAQKNATTTETEMNVSGLPNGNYIMSIRNESGVTNKLVSVLK
ncbi:MAG: T9SS type A sorting domain-containing protein [Bacteroidetes bacterium]|nr:T9SS type A sorting domain-containing protein [Bacteroidota bacterium]